MLDFIVSAINNLKPFRYKHCSVLLLFPKYLLLSISDVKANWSIANDTCVQQGGKLIHDEYYLAQYQVYANTADNYWTGLRRVGDTSEFNSTDGLNTPIWFDWKYNNPKD